MFIVGVVSWSSPSSEFVGCNAWQNWTYVVKIKTWDPPEEALFNVADTRLEVTNVQRDKTYGVQVKVWSAEAGTSWSEQFVAKPVMSDFQEEIELILVTNYSVFSATMFEANKTTVVAIQGVKDLSVAGDVLVMTNGTHLISGTRTIRPSLKADKVAYDASTDSIFFFNSDEQTIIRFHGNVSQPLPMIAAGLTRLEISCHLGKLCWLKSGTSILCSDLNGENLQVVFSVQSQGKRTILSFTLGEDNKLYAVIRSWGARRSPYQLEMLSLVDQTHRFIEDFEVPLDHSHDFKTLKYLPGRLGWMATSKTSLEQSVLMYDLASGSLAKLSVGDAVHHQVVVAFDFKNTLKNTMPLNAAVIPEAVKRVDFSDATLSWPPVTNVNYGGSVAYDCFVKINSETGRYFTTTDTKLHLDRLDLPPFSRVAFAIAPKTNWGKGAETSFEFRSRGAESSPPTRLRVYHERIGAQRHRFEIRFDEPDMPNGNLSNYAIQVHCQRRKCRHLSSKYDVVERKLTLEATIAEDDGDHVSFSVRGENKDEGFVGQSANKLVLLKDSDPVPVLLLKKRSQFLLMDLDDNATLATFHYPKQVRLLTGMSPKNLTYFVTESNTIMEFNLTSGYAKPFLKSDFELSSLAVDPVGDFLYLAKSEIGKSTVEQVSMSDKSVKTVWSTKDQIFKLVLDPFQADRLYVSTLGQTADLKVVSLRTMDAAAVPSGCHCRDLFPGILPEFSVVRSEGRSHVVAIQAKSNRLIKVTDDACQCKVLADRTRGPVKDLIGLGKTLIYLRQDGRLRRLKGEEIMSQVDAAASFSQGHWVERACLQPALDGEVRAAEVDSTSLTLKLPSASDNANVCNNLYPRTLYRISIANRTIETSNATVRLTALQPFTDYRVDVVAMNAYGRLRSFVALLKTAEGAPSAPRNVTAFALSPSSVLVAWLPSLETNGVGSVKYQVVYAHLHHVDLDRHVAAKGQSEGHRLVLTDLQPNQTYQVWVLASSKSDRDSKSTPVTVRTFQAPDLVVPFEIKPRSISFKWSSSQTNIAEHQWVVRPR